MDQKTIERMETRIRGAMIGHDVAALELLLDDSLLFVNQLGLRLTKQDDINAHKQNAFTIHTIDVSQQTIAIHGDIGIATSEALVTASMDGISKTDSIVYTRVWRQSGTGVRLIAGSAVSVPKTDGSTGIHIHKWDGCVCTMCGKTRHKWKLQDDPLSWIDHGDMRCARCGELRLGEPDPPDRSREPAPDEPDGYERDNPAGYDGWGWPDDD